MVKKLKINNEELSMLIFHLSNRLGEVYKPSEKSIALLNKLSLLDMEAINLEGYLCEGCQIYFQIEKYEKTPYKETVDERPFCPCCGSQNDVEEDQ